MPLSTTVLTLLVVASAFAQDTRVILLGTGTPNPEPQRMGPAVAVVSGDRVYFVDCGPGVVRRAVDGTQPHTAAAYEIRARDVKPGEVYRDDGMRVLAFAVSHGTWKHAYGYLFEANRPVAEVQSAACLRARFCGVNGLHRTATVRERASGLLPRAAKDKTIVISGDTTSDPTVATAGKGCDILVHDVYSAKGENHTRPGRRDESRRGTHECVRHNATRCRLVGGSWPGAPLPRNYYRKYARSTRAKSFTARTWR